MHLRLKTKITLIMAFLVLAVVGVNSTLYVVTLARQVIRQADNRARLVSQQVFFQAQNALADSARAGEAPASNSPEDMHAYVLKSLDENAALTSLIDAEVGYSFLVYEVTITDVNGTVLISSDVSLPGKQSPTRTNLAQLVTSSFLGQLRAIYGPPRSYEVTYPFQLGPPGNQVPFGVIRVAAQTGLLRNDITPALRPAALLALASLGISVLLAALVSSASLAPLKRITAQLDRISKGEFDQKPLESGDEFGQVSTKISKIGMQLRGVREIFSTLRENLDQVLGGLDDGLLLFSLDGRAVMVSPAVERFLTMSSDHLLGRRAEDIFPPDHPVRGAIKLLDGEFEPVDAAEVVLASPDSPGRRVGVTVQVLDNEIDRLDTVVKRFLDFTRPPEMHQEETSLKDLLEEVLAVGKPQMDRASVKVEAHFATDVPFVLVDRELLKQALMNLLLNAVEAMPGGGRLTVSLERRGEMAGIEMQDTGRGIAPERRKRVCQLC